MGSECMGRHSNYITICFFNNFFSNYLLPLIILQLRTNGNMPPGGKIEEICTVPDFQKISGTQYNLNCVLEIG